MGKRYESKYLIRRTKMGNNKKTAKPQKPSNRKLLQDVVEILKNHVTVQVSNKKIKKIETVATLVKSSKTILTNGIIIILIGLFIFLIFLELFKNVVMIYPFEVPKELENQGYTGKVIANKFYDKINFIYNEAKAGIKCQEILPEWSMQQLDFELLGSGISLNSIILYLKKIMGIETSSIGGEVVIQKNQMYTTIRISGKTVKTKTISGDLRELENENILVETAKDLYKYLDPFILASYLYFYEKNKDASLETIQYILSNDPSDDDCWAYGLWGVILKDQRDLENAIDKFNLSIKCNPKFSLAYNCLGSILRGGKKYKDAISMYKMAIKLDPEFSSPFINWGNLLQEQGDYDGAIKKYKKAVKLDQKSSYAFANWGNVLFMQGDYKGAIYKYEKAIQIDPKLAWPYANWGLALHNLKDYRGAIVKCEKAIQLDPKDPRHYNFLGNALREQKDFKGAIENYIKAIELDPKSAEPYTNWGDTLLEQKDYEGAIEKYIMAIKFYPENPDAYYGLGVALYNKNDFKGAIERFQKAIQLDSNKILGKLTSNEIKMLFQPIIIEIMNRLKKIQKAWLLFKFPFFNDESFTNL